MTAAVLTSLPLQAGSALMSAASRAALWGLARYAKAPLSNTAILALATFSLMAGSNALYFQHHRHPSPMFGAPGQSVEVAQPMPVVPAVRKGKTVVPNVEQQTTTGSVPVKQVKPVAPAVAETPLGNAEVLEIQRKLTAFGYFDGTIDGYYGPRTARAIKQFEEAHGLKVRGMLTREIVQTIMSAPITTQRPEPTPLVAPEPVAEAPSLATETIAVTPLVAEPQPQAAPLVTAEPEADPLPEPAPLEATLAPSAPANRELPATPQEAVNIAVDVAGNALGAAVDAIQGKVQMGPSTLVQPMPEPIQQAEAEEADPVADIVTASTTPVIEPVKVPVSSTEPRLVMKVQQGLANLGFLHGTIDGVAGEATAKAVRNFEVYFNYDVTGRITPELVGLLTDAGAYI